VQAHGTKTAFEDMATGKCDIGMASRQIKSDEAQKCAHAGLGACSRLPAKMFSVWMASLYS